MKLYFLKLLPLQLLYLKLLLLKVFHFELFLFKNILLKNLIFEIIPLEIPRMESFWILKSAIPDQLLDKSIYKQIWNLKINVNYHFPVYQCCLIDHLTLFFYWRLEETWSIHKPGFGPQIEVFISFDHFLWPHIRMK